ncbi:MAG TPA: AI-2E family transporter [Azospirillaceae bacterium]|nr:AI-2E family transporter [Azospirillaceae bacterium]
MPEETVIQSTYAEARAEQAELPRHDPARVQKIALCCLLGLAVMYTLYFAQDILLPVALAFLMSMLLRPLVKQLRRLGVPEMGGAALVVTGLILVMGFGAYKLSAPAMEWVDRAPSLSRELKAKFAELRRPIQQARQATEQLQQMTSVEEKDRTPAVVVKGPSLADRLLTQTQLVVAQSLMVIGLLFFFLAFGRPTLEAVIRSIPRVEGRLHLADIVNTVQINIASYLSTITVINLALGALATLAFWALGLPNPVLFGMLVGLMNFIPILGPVVMAAILFVVGLLTFESWLRILAPAAVHLLLHTVESNVVTPAIIGRRLTLNPIFVFGAVLFWGWLWGVPGALLAVPILAVFKILCDATPPLRTLGALLGG